MGLSYMFVEFLDLLANFQGGIFSVCAPSLLGLTSAKISPAMVNPLWDLVGIVFAISHDDEGGVHGKGGVHYSAHEHGPLWGVDPVAYGALFHSLACQ